MGFRGKFSQLRFQGQLTASRGWRRLARLIRFVALLIGLTALMFAAWALSALLLPQGVLRPYFSRLFALHGGSLTFWAVFIPNLLPFLGVQFMNLYRVEGRPGGIYVLPVFWILSGVIYGTDSFVFAGEPAPFSLSILWSRTGFNELLAYTLGYEASRAWALWQQRGLWQIQRLPGSRWQPNAEDGVYWFAGLLALVVAVAREVA